jgi:urease accessory protein
MSMVEPIYAPVQPDPDWIVGKYALMNVRAHHRNGRTEIEPRRWRIPFQWQGYHYQDHDDEPFMLMVNSGGGFVEGDVSHFHAHLEPGTRALFTTTASSKFYKCLEGAVSREIVDIHVGEDALLEFYPDEAIPYEWSQVHRINRINMAPTSRLFATDMISAGRVHYGEGEVFKFDHLVSEFQIAIEGRPIALDRLIATDPEAIAALERLWRGHRHMATVFGYAPELPSGIEDDVRAATANVDDTETGVTRIGDLVVTRILSGETWQAHEAIFKTWEALRPSIAAKAARPILKC